MLGANTRASYGPIETNFIAADVIRGLTGSVTIRNATLENSSFVGPISTNNITAPAGSMTMSTAVGDINTVSAGEVNSTSVGDTNISSSADVVIQGADTTTVEAVNNLNVTSNTGDVNLTAAGNVNILSGANVVDFNGATLVNVGGISTDPDDITFITPVLRTTDAALHLLINYPTVADQTYCGDIHIIGRSLGGLGLALFFIKSFDMVNTGGVITSAEVLDYSNRKTGDLLTGPYFNLTYVGNAFNISVAGVAGITVDWKAFMHIRKTHAP